ncbi:PD-(D/E)XK nuclease family protein [Pleurocapsa sp. CCALA 161]|uniref:PD-(D/E)XK nuclease family protein n=1 Tax=Pleurocapsa sp. CCALA 161 TaxID=2107688 RepID=UPI000D0707A0|nr:PD-(D/E)XK nuclease family protein [Pleurocapsa sp. CCALA 161]PSB10590.1 PD-(D/E)XK nuclease family protein [Pleurocapsa sp. CCALA 161]
MPDQDLIRLSQSHLNLLSICPPKFQQVYIDCLGSLSAPKQQDTMEWGSRFHLLMQQRELTLPIEPLLATDTELDSSLKALIQAAPELAPNPQVWRSAEHCRTLSMGNFLFTVIYDLLIAENDRAVILDWKTYRQPIGIKKLKQNWQTRLYLYVLVETSEYKPEQVQMTYWFVKSGQPKNVTIKYSQQEHQQAEQELTILLSNLATWLQNYREFQADFPHRPDCETTCRYYQDFVTADVQQKMLKSIEDIEEISI